MIRFMTEVGEPFLNAHPGLFLGVIVALLVASVVAARERT